MGLERNDRRRGKNAQPKEAGYRLPDGRWVGLADVHKIPAPDDPIADEAAKEDTSTRDSVSALLVFLALVMMFVGATFLWGVWMALLSIGGIILVLGMVLALV